MQSNSDRTQNIIQEITVRISCGRLRMKIQLYVDLFETDMTYAYLLDGAGFSIYDCDPSQQDLAVPMTGA